jgi:hypothetical protein
VNRSIRKALKEYKTDEFETKDNSVSFKNSGISGKSRSNIAYMTIVDNGTFTVRHENNKTYILYESYSSYWLYVIIFLFLCFAGYQSLAFFIGGGLIFGFGVLMTYLTIRNGGLALLNKVKEQIENKKTDE